MLLSLLTFSTWKSNMRISSPLEFQTLAGSHTHFLNINRGRNAATCCGKNKINNNKHKCLQISVNVYKHLDNLCSFSSFLYLFQFSSSPYNLTHFKPAHWATAEAWVTNKFTKCTCSLGLRAGGVETPVASQSTCKTLTPVLPVVFIKEEIHCLLDSKNSFKLVLTFKMLFRNSEQCWRGRAKKVSRYSRHLALLVSYHLQCTAQCKCSLQAGWHQMCICNCVSLLLFVMVRNSG